MKFQLICFAAMLCYYGNYVDCIHQANHHIFNSLPHHTFFNFENPAVHHDGDDAVAASPSADDSAVHSSSSGCIALDTPMNQIPHGMFDEHNMKQIKDVLQVAAFTKLTEMSDKTNLAKTLTGKIDDLSIKLYSKNLDFQDDFVTMHEKYIAANRCMGGCLIINSTSMMHVIDDYDGSSNCSIEEFCPGMPLLSSVKEEFGRILERSRDTRKILARKIEKANEMQELLTELKSELLALKFDFTLFDAGVALTEKYLEPEDCQ